MCLVCPILGELFRIEFEQLKAKERREDNDKSGLSVLLALSEIPVETLNYV